MTVKSKKVRTRGRSICDDVLFVQLLSCLAAKNRAHQKSYHQLFDKKSKKFRKLEHLIQ